MLIAIHRLDRHLTEIWRDSGPGYRIVAKSRPTTRSATSNSDAGPMRARRDRRKGAKPGGRARNKETWPPPCGARLQAVDHVEWTIRIVDAAFAAVGSFEAAEYLCLLWSGAAFAAVTLVPPAQNEARRTSHARVRGWGVWDPISFPECEHRSMRSLIAAFDGEWGGRNHKSVGPPTAEAANPR